MIALSSFSQIMFGHRICHLLWLSLILTFLLALHVLKFLYLKEMSHIMDSHLNNIVSNLIKLSNMRSISKLIETWIFISLLGNQPKWMVLFLKLWNLLLHISGLNFIPNLKILYINLEFGGNYSKNKTKLYKNIWDCWK